MNGDGTYSIPIAEKDSDKIAKAIKVYRLDNSVPASGICGSESDSDKTEKPARVLELTLPICRQSDTLHIYLGRWKKYFTGTFFKQLSSDVLNIPGTDYKNRFMKCENCQFVKFDQKMENTNGQIYLNGVDVVLDPSVDKISLTTTSQKGDLLSKIDLVVSPKMKFFLKVNGKMMKLNSKLDTTEKRPAFKQEDDLQIVSVTDKGVTLPIRKHELWFYPAIPGWSPFPSMGDRLEDFEKRKLVGSPKEIFRLPVWFSDGKGNSWQTVFWLNLAQTAE